MKSINIFIITVGLSICIFILFVVGYWNYAFNREQKRVENHSKIAASAMWDFDTEGMKEYFRLACEAYKYKSVLITHSSGESFIDLNHTFQKPVDRFFISMNLYPSNIIVSDVVFNKKVMGRITVNWYNDSILIYIYALFVNVLILTAMWFYLRTIKAKKELETRVEERTVNLKKEIFERKQAEQELEKFAKRMALHVEQTPLGVVEWDLNFKVLQWNQAAEIIFGYTYEEAIGQEASSIIIPDIAKEHVDQVWRELITQQGGTRSINKNITKNGEIIICDWHNTTLIDSTGTILGVASLISDITDQVKAEKKIKEQKNFIKNAIDAQRDTFFVFDISTGLALQWNKAFENISGYSKDEISSLKAPESYYSKDDLKKVSKYLESILNGEVGTVELELICKDKHRVPTEYSASILSEEEGISNTLIAVGRDVSERKAAEKEKKDLENRLRQAHKMEAIGTLAGGIAHDFNNILAAILGYAEMIHDEVPESSSTGSNIQEILNAGTRAKELVQHILTFSRKSDQECVQVSIHMIVAEALKLLRASIPTTIAIHQDIDPKSGTILSDPTQVHQIIMNLCTNAAQAMDKKGGILEIKLACVELSEEIMQNEPDMKTGQYVKLTVSDNGPGIDKDNIDRIFDPYFTTKEVGKGSGMGLAVVHGIVVSHNGMITVENKPGNGVTFNVFFPKAEEILKQETEKAVPLPTGNEHILVVDDEVAVAKITKLRLESLGYKVTSEIDSIAALELFRSESNNFDLILTDQTMPNMTGEQLAKELINIRHDIPIIICSGYSSKIIDADNAKQKAISAFIMKPVELKFLAKTIREVLDAQKHK